MDKRLTNQELFDNACLGIIGQDHMPAMDGGACVALSRDGKRRCALGWSVTDTKPGMATSPQWDRLNMPGTIAEGLRGAHDESLRSGGRSAWENEMARLAIVWGLDDSCLWMTKV